MVRILVKHTVYSYAGNDTLLVWCNCILFIVLHCIVNTVVAIHVFRTDPLELSCLVECVAILSFECKL
jgi:hypothetical protein